MARGLNKVTLIGHLGQDPETRYTTNNRAVCTVSLATTDRWKDKNTNEPQERTEWHRLVFWGALAEVVEKYLRKGSLVYVEGRLQTRKWQDQSGADRYTTEIVVSDMNMLDSRKDTMGSMGSEQGGDQGHNPAQAPVQDDSTFDDDIPF